MRIRRLPLLPALLASLALHAFVVGGGEFVLPDLFTSPDEVLERRQPTHVQRVQLATRPSEPEAPVAPKGLRMVAIVPAPAVRQAATPQKHPKPAEAPAQADPEPEPSPSPDEAQAAATSPPAATPAPPEAIPAPAPEPAPAFPVQLEARLEARFAGIPVTLNQRWIMEGYRYFIEQSGKKFGFSARMTSEGHLSPEGGLIPERSENRLNDDIKSQSSYAQGIIRYGKPGSLREAPLVAVPQDLASLPFHLAVTFNGQPMTVMITTGRKVYQVRFFLDAEEKVRLPIGTLRTLHLYGEKFDDGLGEMVRAYEVWLAPDYVNYPVKVVGHLSGGERFEYRVSSLEIEGKLVLGARDESEIAAPDEAIPAWLQQRVRQEGLNKP